MRPIAKLLVCAFLLLTGCTSGESETVGGKDYDAAVYSYEFSNGPKRHFVRVLAPFDVGIRLTAETLDDAEINERLEAFGVVSQRAARKFCKPSPFVWDADPIVLTEVSALLMYSGHQGDASAPQIWRGGGDPPPAVYERLFHCEG